jgi:uncharacterized protein (DUF433 family)
MTSDEPIIRNNRNNTPAVRGTRLTVYSIMDNYFDGETAESIAEFYRISFEEAAASIDYINSHMVELMPDYRKMLETDRQGNPPHIEAIFAKSHEKLIRLKAEFDAKRVEAHDVSVAG